MIPLLRWYMWGIHLVMCTLTLTVGVYIMAPDTGTGPGMVIIITQDRSPMATMSTGIRIRDGDSPLECPMDG